MKKKEKGEREKSMKTYMLFSVNTMATIMDTAFCAIIPTG